MLLEKKVAEIFITSKKTLAIAESCTGGLLSHRLTNIPGSSQFFKGGLIVYSNESKRKLLKISPKTIKRHGAVSREVAIALARNVRKSFHTDLGISLTGIAGPTRLPDGQAGASRLKPVGLVFMAIASSQKAFCFKYHFKGSRKEIKRQATTMALKHIIEFLI